MLSSGVSLTIPGALPLGNTTGGGTGGGGGSGGGGNTGGPISYTGDYGKPGVDVGGSSPLARGTGRRQCSLNRRRSVHPRWRGEQVKVPREANWPIGSSPLARGTG